MTKIEKYYRKISISISISLLILVSLIYVIYGIQPIEKIENKIYKIETRTNTIIKDMKLKTLNVLELKKDLKKQKEIVDNNRKMSINSKKLGKELNEIFMNLSGLFPFFNISVNCMDDSEYLNVAHVELLIYGNSRDIKDIQVREKYEKAVRDLIYYFTTSISKELSIHKGIHRINDNTIQFLIVKGA